MDAAETTAQTIPDVIHGFGLSSFYYSVEVAATMTIVVVALAEWVTSSAATTAMAVTAAVNGLSS